MDNKLYHLVGHLKQIDVDFDSTVAVSHFNQNAYNQIRDQGLLLTDISLIHYASIHYQSRFANSLSRRFRHTLDTIEPSIIQSSTNGFLFSGNEDPELQKVTSEVIGVGFAICLMHRLLDVRLNAINKLPGTGSKKRCDYEVVKNNSRIVFESKGRQNDIVGAKREVLSQKRNYPDSVKYGIISHIPRNNVPSQLYVTDPENEPEEIDKNHRIISLLNHYSRSARLAGFYRLSEKLNQRLYDISRAGNDTERFRGKSLDYGNVLKLGSTLQFKVEDFAFVAFFSPGLENGLKLSLGDKSMLIFGMDESIIRIIDAQDYEHLLEYKHKNVIHHKYSVLDNGTFILRESQEKVMEAIGSK